jgi:two-component system, chemotaxis family, sensor kinase CheA
MNLDMATFRQAFFEESADILSELEGYLLQLEDAPEDLELLNTIFRCAHSIKGGSATFGLTEIAQFTHHLETLLDQLRNGKRKVDRSIGELLLLSLDQLKALMAYAQGESAVCPDTADLTARLEAATHGTGDVETAAMPTDDAVSLPVETASDSDGIKAYTVAYRPDSDVMQRGMNPSLFFLLLDEAGEAVGTHCDWSALPPLAEIEPECCYLRWEIAYQSDWDIERLREHFEFVEDTGEVVVMQANAAAIESEMCLQIQSEPIVAQKTLPVEPELKISSAPIKNESAAVPASKPASAAKPEAQTVRVATDKIDKLINLVGELVINQSMLNECVHNFTMAKLPQLREAVAEMERASRELQERVMAVRMLPIKHAFGRFPRLVHDLSVACGKKIELKTAGEETELDKSVIEAIADPLTHLIRNSIDHGLEPPEERIAAGKNETGSVMLSASHEGGSIVIEISDDGRGLNRDRILAKALERGLISESDPTPTDDVIYNLIFHPGFSTAAQVTDLSGRGVGMDIVKQAIQGLGGSVTLSSTPGAGTHFRIRLPLTLAILEGLSLSVGEETYIIPLTSIIESIRPGETDVRLVAGRSEIAVVREEMIPLLRLYQIFGVKPFVTDVTEGLLVIVEYEGIKVAIMVDELIGQSQVVIKSLEANYGKVVGIAGATILGDGRVALIVDVHGLIERAFAAGSSYSLAAA